MKKFNALSLCIISLILLLSACGNNISSTAVTSDPFEKFNRKVFTFNKYLDKSIVEPISKKYVATVPFKARKSINLNLNWMNLPNTFLNSLLQLDIENSVLASAKFMLNGLTLGFYDLDQNETKVDRKNFGSTLANYNIPEGPFLMIPFLGPRNTRDFAGLIIDRQNLTYITPNNFNDINLISVPLNIIDKRESLTATINSINNSSDPYIKVRSFYIQNRRANVYNNKYIKAKDKEKDEEFEKLLQ